MLDKNTTMEQVYQLLGPVRLTTKSADLVSCIALMNVLADLEQTKRSLMIHDPIISKLESFEQEKVEIEKSQIKVAKKLKELGMSCNLVEQLINS